MVEASSLPDPREDRIPPALAAQQRKIEHAIGARSKPAPASPAEDPPDSEEDTEQEQQPSVDINPAERISARLVARRSETAVIGLPEGSPIPSVSFEVLHSSINDAGIAFFVPSSFASEPVVLAEFPLTFHGKTHKVLYAGGFFPFPQEGFSLISFMFVPDKTK